MAQQSTASRIQLHNITAFMTLNVNTLQILADSFNTPFMDMIFNTAQSLTKIVQVNFPS
jgi:hypothetical protein